MSRIDLPDGAWAELHSPKKVSERKRRRFITAMADFNKSVNLLPRDDKGEVDPRTFGAEQQELLDMALDLLTLALVSTWSFDVSVSVDSLCDLDADAFDALRKACMALQGEVLPDYGPDPDPKADTGVSES